MHGTPDIGMERDKSWKRMVPWTDLNNHLLFMDDLKLGKLVSKWTLLQTVHTSGRDIGMEFGLKKCGVLIMGNGKTLTQTDGQIMKEVNENGFKFLGLIKVD